MSKLFARWGTLLGMLVVVLLLGAGAPEFFAPDNIFVVLKQGSILALVALALTVVLIAGGFDMSVGAVGQLTANLAAGSLLFGLPTGVAIAIGGVVGIVFGLVNAVLIVGIGMPPFVATLGTMFIAMGTAFAFNHGQALTLSSPADFFFLGQGYLGPVPFIFIVTVAVTMILYLFLKRTRTGLHLYAVGNNLAAARLRGISPGRALALASILGGFLAGIAGTALASYSYGASALATGLDFLISALAAAFLGSALSRTGELDVAWTVVAAIFIASISNGLIINGASNQVLPGIQGAILIGSILFGVIRRRDIGQVLIF